MLICVKKVQSRKRYAIHFIVRMCDVCVREPACRGCIVLMFRACIAACLLVRARNSTYTNLDQARRFALNAATLEAAFTGAIAQCGWDVCVNRPHCTTPWNCQLLNAVS